MGRKQKCVGWNVREILFRRDTRRIALLKCSVQKAVEWRLCKVIADFVWHLTTGLMRVRTDRARRSYLIVPCFNNAFRSSTTNTVEWLNWRGCKTKWPWPYLRSYLYLSEGVDWSYVLYILCQLALSDYLAWCFSVLFPQLYGKCQGIPRKDGARSAFFLISELCCSL